MKTTSYKLMLCCAALLVFASCEKPYDYDKEIGAPTYSAEKLAASINGKWTMNEAKQVDEKSLTKESIDITDFYTADGANRPNIAFNATGQTFTIDTAGLVANFFPVASGKWKFDDERYPTKIELTDINDNAIGSISIGSNLLGPTPKLNYSSTASCSGSVVMSYNVLFSKSK
jgi:hypothetical protein